MSTVSSASSLFTGTSQFSSQLQAALQTAISAAAEPLTQMQTDLTTLQSQQSELNTLNTDFTNLQSAVAAVDSSLGSSSYAASSSESSVASVSVSGTPETGTLTVDVGAAGTYDTSMSSDGLTTVTDPTTGNISDADSFTLTVGSDSTTITPSGTSLQDLADAINQSGAAVEGMVVNIGSSSSPDYRLYLQGTQYGDPGIQLTANDGTEAGESLLTSQTAGQDATYQVNGEPSTPISTSSPTVTLSPGVTATLEGTGTTTINVTRSTAALTTALSNLASAYNTAVSDLNQNHGQSGGALTGDSVVDSLTQTLQNMMGYMTSASSGGISSLSDLGLSFATTGVLSFDPTTIDDASSSQLSQILSFLGSATGGGFLETATNAMTSVLDPSTGYLTTDLSQVGSNIAAEYTDISNETTTISNLQTTLTNQMTTADASIASMEQQLTYMQSLFSATMIEQETIAQG